MPVFRIESSTSALKDALNGHLITPGDAEYDTARAIVPGGYDPRPRMIARPADAAEVARVVTFARDNHLELAVRSGGHTFHSTADDGIVLDLRALKAMHVDVDARTAWAGAGLTAGEYTRIAGAHGLATSFGDTGSVGIGGITLGGGVGFLTRKYGLTIDSLRAAEIVTADGAILRIDDRTHADLFWAIRGGGGNFGVVTRFQYALQPVPQVVGGILLLPATPDVIAGLVAAADAASDDLSIIANIMPAPPMPFVPATYQGTLVVMAMVCCAADAEAGERAVAPLRRLATPIVDGIRPMSYPEMYLPDDDSFHPITVGRTMFLDTVDRGTAAAIVDLLGESDAMMRVVQLRVLGGAAARVPAAATAFAHRTSRIMATIVAFCDNPADRARRQAWAVKVADRLHQNDAGAYVNFLGDEGESRVHAAYPDATWRRLAAVKARYDPTNLFRRNQNIPPAIHHA